MTKAYAIYDPDGKINIYTIGATESHAWILAAQSYTNRTYKLIKEEINNLKRLGYTVRPIQIADKDSVVISKEAIQDVFTLLHEFEVIDHLEGFVELGEPGDIDARKNVEQFLKAANEQEVNSDESNS